MTRHVVASVARRASLFCSGIFSGFLVAVLVLEVTLRDADASLYTQVRRVELVRFDDLATALLLPALLATAVLLIASASFRDGRFWFAAAAQPLLVVVLVITVAVNLPINSAQLGWAVDAPPADWAQIRDRWQLAHAVRTSAALIAYSLLAHAASKRSTDFTARRESALASPQVS